MNAVAKIEQKALAPVSSEPALMSMIERMASDPNVDIDKFERFVAMRDRELARQAEQAFNEAMNVAQSHIGRIAANKENLQTKTWYPTYAALDREIRPVYSSNGFALSFDTEPSQVENMVRVLCYVSHSAGHTRTYRVDMPADGKGAKGGDVMTKTHAAGSAMSYGMRYLLKLIFNVAIGVDIDDDGNGADANPHAKNLAAIAACKTQAELSKVKRDLMEAAGGSADKVPAELRTACTAKASELQKAPKA
jgi:hypothetical protein